MFSWKIFNSVLAALIAFSLLSMLGAFVFLVAFEEAATREMARVVEQQQQAQQRRAQAKRVADARDRARRVLSPHQRCIAGTVIETRGSSSVQVLDAGRRPIKCSGDMAAEAIR